MGRPRAAAVQHEEPIEGEPSFVCTGPCGLRWPQRLCSNRPRRCVNCNRVRVRAKQTRAKSRRAHLRKSYGISVEQVEQMLEAQHGTCAICERTLSLPQGDGGVARDEAVVDHDHNTGTVRGILCPLCNHGLGAFSDNLAHIERAAVYLRTHAQKESS